jgi:DNA (cytosine-5)-methyltransferase 1
LLVATHVNRLALQANDKETKMSDIYGLTSFEPLASYDHDSHSWKMYAVISLWGLTESLETLPKSGMTRNGRLFQQPVLAPLIDATESSAWPTPTTQEVEHPNAELTATGRRKAKNGNSHSLGLADSVRMWPTPTARDHKGAAGFKDENRNFADLTYLAQIRDGHRKYPTMSASGMGNTGSRQILQRRVEFGDMTETELKAMSAGNGGRLNPTWVEWLMGFPLGWTDLEDSETQSSHKSPNMSDE